MALDASNATARPRSEACCATMECSAKIKPQRQRPRVLCLHGGATSASIFKHQLRSVELALGDESELVFIDGRSKVVRSQPEVERAFPGGPYYVHLNRVIDEESETGTGTYTDRDEGVAWLLDVLDNQGPFEGWIGFSQGANLALLTLHHLSMQGAESQASPRLLPRAAVFMSPTQFGWFDPGMPRFHSEEIGIIFVTGRQDPRKSFSQAFIDNCFSRAMVENACILEHPEGHRPLPGEPRARQELVEVLLPKLLHYLKSE